MNVLSLKLEENKKIFRNNFLSISQFLVYFINLIHNVTMLYYINCNIKYDFKNKISLVSSSLVK